MVSHLLTKRQSGYLRLAYAGHTEQEIAEEMGKGARNVRFMRFGVLTRIPAASINEVCRMLEENYALPALFRSFKARPR